MNSKSFAPALSLMMLATLLGSCSGSAPTPPPEGTATVQPTTLGPGTITPTQSPGTIEPKTPGTETVKPTENNNISLTNGGTFVPQRKPGEPIQSLRKILAENSSDTPINISKVELIGDTAFSISNQTCEGETLSPKQLCDIRVIFTDPGPGEYATELILHLSSDNSYKSIQFHEQGQPILPPSSQ
jgi:hypothetical protein